jgi:phosphatidylserine/phosphatidylglycerophosphate/cardiolipin synthase-like enzyme
VWTGSTNISAGGIFGHSNVGHVIRDSALAQRYLDYWNRLAAPNATRAALVKADLAVEPTPPSKSELPADRMLTLFCPRDDEKSIQTLHWYGDLMDSAQRIVCMTFAFNLDPIFAQVLKKPGATLRYAVFDKDIDAADETEIDRVANTVVASGAKFQAGDIEGFIGEVLTGFNKNQYIHDKFMLVDPLGNDPKVVTGTANFSGPSQYANDENMVVIRGGTRVADIYFGEFMRIFDHLYSRYIVEKLKKEGKSDPDSGFLKETGDWVAQNFQPGTRKDLRRRYFMGQ